MKSSLIYLFVTASVFLSAVCAEEDIPVEDDVKAASSYDPAATPTGSFVLLENFQSGIEWVSSANSQYAGTVSQSVIDGLEGDFGMELPAKAMHYGASKPLSALDPSDGLVFQYEITLKNGWECGGGYFKLLSKSEDLDLEELEGSTPYSIMFGPDKCGSTNKVHLILRHKKPSGEIEEKHLTSPPSLAKLDKLPHLYTVVLKPDNSYKVLVDNEVKKEGSLLEDFTPPVNPPKEIDDPEDFKPKDWVDEAMIPDSTAVKPDDWDEDEPEEIEDVEAEKPEGWADDEPEEIDDPEAEKPEDWDDDEDGDWDAPKIANPSCEIGCGEWKRPMIPNPAFKGKWSPPMIDNPEYKGEWAPRQIPNPDYFEDLEPLKNIGSIAAVALEVWQMSDGIVFDNVLLTTSEKVATEYAEKTWAKRYSVLKAAGDKEAETEVDPAEFMVPSWLEDLLNLPALQSVKPTVEPLVKNAFEVYGVTKIAIAVGVSLVFFFLLLAFCCCSSSGPTVDPVAEAKKEDVTGEDDKEDKEEETEEIKEEDEVVEKKTTRRRG